MRPRYAAFVVLLSAMLMTLCFVATEPVFAEYEDYDTNEFNVDARIDEDHTIHVTETIKVDFNQSAHHGIMRYIPFADKLYQIHGIDVEGWEYSVDSEHWPSGNGYKVIRIGSADELVSGPQTFRLHYDLKCFRDDQPDADYLSYDMLPTGWNTPIAKATCTLRLPKAIDWKALKLYSGQYGEKADASQYFDVSIDENTNTITAKGRALPYRVGLTAAATLEEGYWVNPANRDFVWTILYVILALIPLIAVLLWVRWGRDPQIVRTVEFYPPENLSPCELGYIVDGRVDDKDIASMMMYFADKGLLSVEEYKKNKFRIHKLKDIDSNEKRFIKDIFQALWKSGKTVDLSKKNTAMGEALYRAKDRIIGYYNSDNRRLYSSAAEVCRYVGQILMLLPSLVGIILVAYANFEIWESVLAVAPLVIQVIGMRKVMKNYDAKDARSFSRNVMSFVIGIAVTIVGLGIAAALIVSMMNGKLLVAGVMLVSAAVTFFFVVFMRARTKHTAELMGKILGFRDFIRTAEYDRLKMLSDENPDYFFNILPYAYVMGMSTRWARKFTDIDIHPPVWASGYDDGWVYMPMWYGSMMNNTAADMADKYHAAMIDDLKADFGDIAGGGGGIGGGFGGGGFSGGGFGGGGGGAW